jgi:hypothetical protein
MRILTRVAMLGVAGMVVVGCGGGGGSSSTSTTAAGGGGGFDTTALKKYTKCLSKHGVKLPSRPGNGAPPNGGSFPAGGPPNGGSVPEGATPPNGGNGGGGIPGVDQNDPKVKEAMTACASLQPQFPNQNTPPSSTGQSS